MIDLIFPWPPTSLSPNTRQHYQALAKAKKAYRTVCSWYAIEQGAGKIDAQKLRVCLTFVPPNRRGFDLDNLLARMKSGLDGLADVLGVDDRNWKLEIDKAEPNTIGGMVKVRIEVLEVVSPMVSTGVGA